MKLCFVHTVPIWGGGEAWTLSTSLAMRRRGHEVVVVADRTSRLWRELEESELRRIPYQASLIGRFRSLIRLRRAVAGSWPDVWVTGCLRDIWLVNCVQTLKSRSSVIFRRGLDCPVPDHYFMRRRLARVTHWIVPSRALRKTLVESHDWIDHKGISVVPNGVPVGAVGDEEKIDGARSRLQEVGPVLGFCGRLVHQKGLDLLLEALPRIAKSHPKLQLMIVGDGGLRETLRNRARELQILDRCLFVGEADDPAPFLASCDLVVFPSRFEGGSRALLETMALGKAVLASDASNFPEVITHGESGLLFRTGDVPDLSRQILALLEHERERERLGKNARGRILNHFSQEQMFDACETLFHQYAAGGEEEKSSGFSEARGIH